MKNIFEFSNIIKYDFTKCDQCNECILKCKTNALTLVNNSLQYSKDKCIACKNCIKVCKSHALYFNINDGVLEGANVIALVPYDADSKFLNKKYNEIITYELGEKVKVVETAFEMERKTSQKINDNPTTPLIISDIENIELILKYIYPGQKKYLTKVKNIFYLSSYLYRLLNKNKNVKISSYGVPFENKIYFDGKKIIDEICDIPYKINYKYNVLDILNNYMKLCKLECDISLDLIDIENNSTLVLKNKYITVKVLLLNELSYISTLNFDMYDFIFVCKYKKYKLNELLLKDKELNYLYKNKLKAPGQIEYFFVKE